MNPIKLKRLESRIVDIINRTLVIEVIDNHAKLARVTYAVLKPDLSVVKCYIDSLDHHEIENSLIGLNKLKGLFRKKMADEFSTFRIPQITFEIDKTIDYAENIDKIIKEIHSKE